MHAYIEWFNYLAFEINHNLYFKMIKAQGYDSRISSHAQNGLLYF